MRCEPGHLADARAGLSQLAAQQRLTADGANELPSSQPLSLLAIAWVILREPMFILLVACGSVYLLLGSRQDAFILLGSVVIIMAMDFFQERKSARALEALRDLSSPRALVLRDGQQRRIAGRDVVCGDVILLAEGDRVPADAVLFANQGLLLDESLLSGESVPVRKNAITTDAALPQAMAKPGGEDQPWLYSGSLVVQGKGSALVLAIGEKTMLGQIGKALVGLKDEPSQVQLETAVAVKQVAIACIGLVLLLAVWYGVTRHDWLNGILAGLTLAMALLPMELPLVLAIFLGLGAWRMAQQQVLTRRTSAIEMLGAATVLCVDKTGTLTQNRMALTQMVADGQVHVFDVVASQSTAPTALPEVFHATLEFAMLASQRTPVDPMEQAIQAMGKLALADTEHIHIGWTLVEEYPLSPQLLAMSRVWQSPDLADYVIAAKGAPEAIFDLCHLSPERVASLSAEANRLAAQGLRVLGVARASFQHAILPQGIHDFDFVLLGLVALADPLRPTVVGALAQCHAAGIRVIMITGDYPATAHSIARQAGLKVFGQPLDGIITGVELDALDEAQLQARLQQSDAINIFCRVQPEQKLRLVTALKQAGGVVAMTGDGVNDAPPLKAAHIGIAMGERGTDVAREAAALVLLDDDLSSIVAAVRLGRRIFDNIRKAVVFIIAAHVPIAAMSLLPVFLGWPLLLLPIHVVFFELMIGPTCSIVFEGEPEEANVMQRPPRERAARIFDKALLLRGLTQGSLLVVLQLGLYVLTQHLGWSTGQSRAITFSAMVLGDIGLIFVNRNSALPWYRAMALPNPALWWVVLSALGMLALALTVPVLRSLFHFV